MCDEVVNVPTPLTCMHMLCVKGSYDHTVRLFDTRTDRSTTTIDHGLPVESVLFHPAGSLLFTAGTHNRLRFWCFQCENCPLNWHCVERSVEDMKWVCM